jgi:hypothetical protein
MVLATRVTRWCPLHLCITTIDDYLSDNAIYDFSKKAVENGLDIFRVFDSLNYFGTFRWVVCYRID